MAEDTGALDLIPEGSQYDNLRFALQRLQTDFPDKYESLSGQKARIQGWVEEIDSPDGRDADQIRDDIVQYVIGFDDARSAYGVTQEEFDQLVLGANEGGINFGDLPEVTPTGREGDEDALTLMESPTARWLQDSKTGLFYIEYQLPGGAGTVIFEAEQEQIESMFGSDQPPNAQNFDFDRYTRRSSVHFGGNVAEIAGDGSFEDEVDRVTTLALDRGDLPDWIKDDPKALDLLFVYAMEEHTEGWFYENLSQLDSFKQRYPGVADLESRGMSIVDAVQAHTEFEANLKKLHAAAGFSPDAISPDIVGNLISRGYSTKQVGDSYQVWKRMRDHAPAMQAFNEVLEANGMEPIRGAGKMYEFLQGNAPIEIYDLYEASSINEAAEASGFGDIFTGQDALSLAIETERDIGLDKAFESFTTAAQQALRLRHELAVEKFGLEVDDLIDLSFGRAPRSGKTAAEVGETLARLSASAQRELRGRSQPFVGFDEQGRPQSRSLSGLRQQQ